MADARSNASDELVIVKDGKLVGDWTFTKARAPIQTMSITKSILSLGVGTLVDAGKLRLRQPVSDFYAEWGKGEYAKITLYDLLTHSAGIAEGEHTLDIYRSRSFVDFTLKSTLDHEPGTHYRYSNRGANLVSGIIGKASGMRTDRYLDKVLFKPLGITNWWWSRDRAGTPHGLAGLHLVPRDLARIGELIDGDGQWGDKQLVSQRWLARSTRTLAKVQPDNRRLGLYWWLVPAWTRVVVDDAVVDKWRVAGVDAAFIAKVAPIRGKVFHSASAFVAALRALFNDPKLREWTDNTTKKDLADAHFEYGPLVGTYSEGTLGQFVVVLPRDHLVAVRMRRMPKDAAERDDPDKAFPDFVERVQGLLQ